MLQLHATSVRTYSKYGHNTTEPTLLFEPKYSRHSLAYQTHRHTDILMFGTFRKNASSGGSQLAGIQVSSGEEMSFTEDKTGRSDLERNVFILVSVVEWQRRWW